MIKWKLYKNLVSELFLKDGFNFINPWGLETADSWSFFSLEQGVGYRYKILREKIECDENTLYQEMDIKFHEGSFSLTHKEILSEKAITRESHLTALSDATFMDFVQRYRFKKEFFDYAVIAGKKIIHSNSNIYYQFPVKDVLLQGKELAVKVSIKNAETASKFLPMMYVRDRGDEWIVHVRMIPILDSNIVIKLCSRFFKTSPLPPWLTSAILKVPGLKKALLYRSERSPYRSKIMNFFAPNAFPLVSLKKDEQLHWTSEMEIL